MSGDLKGAADPAEAPGEAAIDEIPDEVRVAARAAFASRDRRSQVLDLVSDSLVDDQPGPGPRTLVFALPGGPEVQVTVVDVPGHDAVRLDVHSTDEELHVLGTRSGPGPSEQVPPDQAAADVLPHGLVTVTLGRGDQRFQTAAVRV